MKIAILTNNEFTDAFWTDPRVYKQAQALMAAGHEVVVLGTGKYGQVPLRQEEKDGIRILRRPTLMHLLYSVIRPPSAAARDGKRQRNEYYQRDSASLANKVVQHVMQFAHDLNTLLFVFAVLPAAVREKADVYVGRGLEGLAPAYLAACLTKAKLVYDSLELWADRVRAVPYGPWHQAIVKWLEKVMCRRCDLVIVVTQSIAEILADWYGIPEPLVIPNAYHSYDEATASDDVRELLGGCPDRKVVIYVGFLDRGKGLEYLIDAAQYLDANIVIAIVGDGVLRSALEARIEDRHVTDRVRLIGWVKSTDLPTYIASADLGVTAMQGDTLNYYYNIDYKPFHYIVSGIPLAVSNQPEKKRLVDQNRIGAAFDEKDPHDIARVINELLADPERYSAMRARVQKLGREELNWEVVSRVYVEAIERIADKNRRRE